MALLESAFDLLFVSISSFALLTLLLALWASVLASSALGDSFLFLLAFAELALLATGVVDAWALPFVSVAPVLALFSGDLTPLLSGDFSGALLLVALPAAPSFWVVTVALPEVEAEVLAAATALAAASVSLAFFSASAFIFA